MGKELKIHDVEVKTIENDDEMSDTFFRSCSFCSKIVKMTTTNSLSCSQLSGPDFYCPFCLRNNFHYKTSRNVLIMSYRAIIGHYYYDCYQSQNRFRRLWVSEILRLVKRHMDYGLRNPVFSYDTETMLWFVDFNKVGVSKRKAPFQEVLDTAGEIYDALKIEKIISQHAYNEMWKKFDEAMDTFYQKRQRPKDKKMLIPTFQGIVHGMKEDFFDKTRFFTSCDLVIK